MTEDTFARKDKWVGESGKKPSEVLCHTHTGVAFKLQLLKGISEPKAF